MRRYPEVTALPVIFSSAVLFLIASAMHVSSFPLMVDKNTLLLFAIRSDKSLQSIFLPRLNEGPREQEDVHRDWCVQKRDTQHDTGVSRQVL